MQVAPEELRRPAVEIAHRIARDLLEQISAGRGRLRDKRDAEALHDFRVALRRLRSILRAYEPCLAPSIGKRARRRLKQLAGATTAGRELEVHLDWLRTAREELSPGERRGASWLARRLRSRQRQADAAIRAETARHFAWLERKLAARLTRYTVAVDLDNPASEPPYGAVTAEIIGKLAEQMRSRLAEVRSLDDQTAAHQARISGKRLRYVIEPVASVVPDGAELLAKLKRLQDQLGELHDGDVFAGEIAAAIEEAARDEGRRLTDDVMSGETPQLALRRAGRRDPRRGLVALAARLRTRSEALFAEISAEGWIGGEHPFFGRVAEASEALRAATNPNALRPRQFVLRAMPVTPDDSVRTEIEQGYLPGDRLVEQLRRVQGAEGVHCSRGMRVGSNGAAAWVEEPASPELFETLWALTAGRRITRRRVTVEENGARWILDEFTDRPLVLAHVEVLEEAGTPELPGWLRPYVVEEVTQPEAYEDAALAR